MNLLTIIIYTSLWSSIFLYGQTVIANVKALGAFYSDSSILNSKTTIPIKSKIIDNLPNSISTGIANLCSPASYAYMLQHYLCQNSPSLRDLSCSDLPNDLKISLLGFMNWEIKNDSSSLNSPYSYSKIPIDDNKFLSATGKLSLKNAILTGFSFYTEDCFSTDQFLNTLTEKFQTNGISSTEALSIFFLKLKTSYNTIQKKYLVEGKFCEECFKNTSDSELSELLNLLNLKNETITTDNLKTLLSLPLDQFLYNLLYGKRCKRKKFNANIPTLDYYPDYGNDEQSIETTNELLNVIMHNMDQSKVTVLSNICMQKNNNDCIDVHVVSITGYKTFEVNGKKITYLQVKQNLGDEVSRYLNDGWVEADTLLSSVIKNGKKFKAGTLTSLNNSST